MAFEARILADSINDLGDRLTTWVATYPRMIHSEMLTHKMLSRSSASSRAIPVVKMLSNIETDPVVPIWWGANEPGMQAFGEVEDKAGAEAWWREGVAANIAHARRGVEMGLHKQIVNRVPESAMWITVIYSTTTVSNLYGLRIHSAAEPHCRKIVTMMKEAQDASTPKKLREGQWHLPLIFEEDWEIANALPLPSIVHVEEHLVKVSVGRVARVSYLTHEGKRDLSEDIKLHDKLIVQEPLHASPGEHVGQAMAYPKWFKKQFPDYAKLSSKELNEVRMALREAQRYSLQDEIPVGDMAVEAALSQIQSGNFRGWRQYRKLHKNEHIGEPMP
jgi:hypothetical protein